MPIDCRPFIEKIVHKVQDREVILTTRRLPANDVLVKLNPSDFEELEPLHETLKEEIVTLLSGANEEPGLIERLAEHIPGRRSSGFEPKVEWTIRFQADTEDRIPCGEVVVLAHPAKGSGGNGGASDPNKTTVAGIAEERVTEPVGAASYTPTQPMAATTAAGWSNGSGSSSNNTADKGKQFLLWTQIEGKRHELRISSTSKQDEYTVGRGESAYTDLAIPRSTVSDRHLVIRTAKNGDQLEVKDLSSGGTFQQKKRLTPKEWKSIGVLPAQLTLADVVLHIEEERARS